MQATDFATADGGFTPVDPPVFFSLPPMMTAAGLLLLAFAVLVGWWLGRESGRANAPAPDKAADEIYEAVLRASTEASTALNNELHARTLHLKGVVDQLLGPVVVLGKGLTGAMKGVDDALKGKVKATHDPHGPGAGGHGHGGAGHVPSTHGAHHATPPADGAPADDRRGGSTAPAAASAAASVSHVMVIGVPVAAPPNDAPHAPAAPSPPPPPTERDMTREEQEEALGKAVRAFHNYWAAPDRRDDLKKARRALCQRPPAHLLPPRPGGSSSGSGNGNWRFGD